MRRIVRFIWPQGPRRWWYRGGFLFVGFLAFSIASAELTSQSWFCNSCHIMNPFYVSWKTSTHKEIGCVSCHIAPGVDNFVMAKLNGLGQVVDDVLSRTSTKPSASVSELACTRSGCHSFDKVRASAPRTKKYLFNHGKHLGLEYSGIAINCTTCHSHVKGNQHFEVNTGVCITCHMVGPEPEKKAAEVQVVSLSAQGGSDAAQAKPGAKIPTRECQRCHEAPTQPIEYRGLKIVHSEYLSYGASCESCHMGVTEKPHAVKDDACVSCHEFGMEKRTGVEEMHHVHSSGRHKVECFSCHGIMNHGPNPHSMQMDRIDCQSCHSGQHAVQQKTYKSAGAEGAAPAEGGAVSPMFMVHVGCTGCHVQPRAVTSKSGTGATVAAATPQACDSCHKPGLGEKTVPLWQKSTKELYQAVSQMLPAETQALSPEATRLAAEARDLLELVRLDGSWGVHNPRYTQKLLEDAQAKLNQIPAPPPSGAGK